MNIIIFIVHYLSSLDMMISCVWLAEVLAEKLMLLATYLEKDGKYEVQLVQ